MLIGADCYLDLVEDDILERFWSIEIMGISQASDDTWKADYFKENQQSSVEYKNESCTAKLP